MVGLFLLLLFYLNPGSSNVVKEPTGRKNIYFVETKSPADRICKFNHRQVCAIESACITNPDWNIFVYIFNVDVIEDNEFYRIILTFPNCFVKKVTTEGFVKGTPAEALIKSGLKTKPEWLISHTSDVMRYVALYKCAGVYMDLDIITFKSLNELSPNFAGMEKPGPEIVLGSAIVGFSDDATGRTVAEWLVNDVSANFSGNSWGANGLDTITRGVCKICKTDSFTEASLERCEGFKVYPMETFFAIPYHRNDEFFSEGYYSVGKESLASSVVTHLWNFLTHDKKVGKNSKTLLADLVKNYCPKVHRNLKEYY